MEYTMDSTDYDAAYLSGVHGTIVDELIESVLGLIWNGAYNEKGFDSSYTDIVRRYINPHCPNLMAEHAGNDRINLGAMHYLNMLRLDFIVRHAGGPDWPPEGFSGIPNATVALSVFYPGTNDEVTDMFPGTSLNQAALGAVIQLCRELADTEHNQPNLLRMN